MNDRAREILSYIQRFAREHGYPPTIREIGGAFEINSTNGVRYYLQMLERDGYMKRLSKRSRGIELKSVSRPLGAPGIPLLGRVAAGQPTLAEENFESRLDTQDLFGDPTGLFGLRVRGDSMIDAGIHDGDFVVVRQQERANAGQIVVALIGEEATVKYYRPKRDRIELEPANATLQPIVVDRDAEFRILGVVKGVMRVV
jgi:repressor LexA